MTTTSIPLTPLSAAAQRGRSQQRLWAALPVRTRLQPVRVLRRLLVKEWDALCAAAARDLGKTTEETLAAEVVPLAEACRFLEQEAGRLLRPRRVPGRHRPLWLWGQSDVVHRRPRGLVGIIGTWNYPLLLNGLQLLQALTAGNAVLWKPSELAPASAAALFDLLSRAGFPADLVQRLEATRAAGQDLLEADIDHLAFTGSAATGRHVASHLGRRLVSCTLELSGCDAMFVLPDADATLAARAAWFGATLNRGQTCLAVRRAFVHRSLYPAFLEALLPLAAAATPVGMALPAQAEQAERLIQEALAEGACLLVPREATPASGGPARFTPTVVADARPEMALCREASFAPLLAVLAFDTLDEALRGDGQCPYGLGASVFTGHPARAARLTDRLRTGMVTVNDVIVPTGHPATPFGGRGASGWGVTQGAEGLLEMTVPQVVSVRAGTFRPHYDLDTAPPAGRIEMLRGLLEWSHGRGLGHRWRGLWQLARGTWRTVKSRAPASSDKGQVPPRGEQRA